MSHITSKEIRLFLAYGGINKKEDKMKRVAIILICSCVIFISCKTEITEPCRDEIITYRHIIATDEEVVVIYEICTCLTEIPEPNKLVEEIYRAEKYLHIPVFVVGNNDDEK